MPVTGSARADGANEISMRGPFDGRRSCPPADGARGRCADSAAAPAVARTIDRSRRARVHHGPVMLAQCGCALGGPAADGNDWFRAATAARLPRRAARLRRCTATRSSARIRTIRDAFTQGLIFRDGVFYEGTGLNGRSSHPQGEARDRRSAAEKPLGAQYFGEGITDWKDRSSSSPGSRRSASSTT